MASAKESRLQALGRADAAALTRLGLDREAVETLEGSFRGTLVYPTSPVYDKDRQESNPAFQAFPKVIAYCEVLDDIRQCLDWARQYGCARR